MKCYPLNEAGEDFRPWVGVYRHRVSDALLREERQDQNTRPASLAAVPEVSGKPMPKEGNPLQCQLQAPNRVTGATVLSIATSFSAPGVIRKICGGTTKYFAADNEFLIRARRTQKSEVRVTGDIKWLPLAPD